MFESNPPLAHIANFHLLLLAVLWALAWLLEQRLQTQQQLEQQGSGPHLRISGRLVGLRGTSRNVTRRHLAEEALQCSEDRLTKLFGSSPGAIAMACVGFSLSERLR